MRCEESFITIKLICHGYLTFSLDICVYETPTETGLIAQSSSRSIQKRRKRFRSPRPGGSLFDRRSKSLVNFTINCPFLAWVITLLQISFHSLCVPCLNIDPVVQNKVYTKKLVMQIYIAGRFQSLREATAILFLFAREQPSCHHVVLGCLRCLLFTRVECWRVLPLVEALFRCIKFWV